MKRYEMLLFFTVGAMASLFIQRRYSADYKQLSTQLSGMSSDINILLQLSEIK